MTMDANIRNTGVAEARLFSYDFLTNAFSGDISTLQANGVDPIAQLYHDACDQGFLMRSHRSGNIAVWYLSDTGKDREGDTTHWTFKPTMATVHHNPVLFDAKVYVWNT